MTTAGPPHLRKCILRKLDNEIFEKSQFIGNCRV